MELIKTIQISKQNRAGQIAHSDRGEQVRIEMKREVLCRYGLWLWLVLRCCCEDMVNLKTEILKNNGDCGMSQ